MTYKEFIMNTVSGPKPVSRIDHNFSECNQHLDQLCNAIKEITERLAPVLADAEEKMPASDPGRPGVAIGGRPAALPHQPRRLLYQVDSLVDWAIGAVAQHDRIKNQR